MALFLLLAFVALPLLEIAVYIEVGGAFGVGPTLARDPADRRSGYDFDAHPGPGHPECRSRQRRQGRDTLRSAFDGACQLIAGIMLLTPGFVTDTIGFLLFVPPVRGLLLAWIIARANVSVVMRDGPVAPHGYDVDGDFRDVTPDAPPSLPPREPGTGFARPGFIRPAPHNPDRRDPNP